MTPTDGRRTAGSSSHDPRRTADNPDVAHEDSDINVRAIIVVRASVLAGVVVAVVVVLMWGLFKVLEHQAAANDPQLSPLARPRPMPTRGVPPSCLRGAAPAADEPKPGEVPGDAGGAARQLRLGRRAGGVAHMPIDEAKKLILQRGLPVRPDAPAIRGRHACVAARRIGGRTRNCQRGADAAGAGAGAGGRPPAPATRRPRQAGVGSNWGRRTLQAM